MTSPCAIHAFFYLNLIFTYFTCYSRLHLPGPVVEDDKSKGSFDATSGDYIVTLSKSVKGQHFKDLDMINALMKPPLGKSIPSIELLKGTYNETPTYICIKTD